MGGTVSSDDVSTFGYEVAMNQLKAELHSNIVPIGRVRKGVHAQRAFLFKVNTLIIIIENKRFSKFFLSFRHWVIVLEYHVH